SFLNLTPTPAISTLSLHDALPISRPLLSARQAELQRRAEPLHPGLEGRLQPGLRRVSGRAGGRVHSGRRSTRLRRGGRSRRAGPDRKSTRLNSSHVAISYAVFCLK